MLSEFFYRAMALMISVGTLSRIQHMEKENLKLSEDFSKLLKHDDKVQRASSQKIICYYRLERNITGRLQPENIDPSLCTHLIVGFVNVQNDFLIPRTAYDIDALQKTVSLKKKHPSLKIILSVGARSRGGFSLMVATFPGRERFIFSALHFLDKYGFDGIDFDWEFPAWNGGNLLDRFHFVLLLKELRHVLKASKKPFLVSAAVPAHVAIVDTSYDVPELAESVDFVNLMSYDFRLYNPEYPFTAHHSPLFSRNSQRKTDYYLNVAWSAHFWEARGMPRNKIMVGIATHARTYELKYAQKSGLDAPVAGPGRGKGKISHAKVCEFLKLGALEMFDISTKVPYATLSKEWVSLENERSIFYKSKWVKEEGFGGIMTYNLNNDDWEGKCYNSTKFPLHKAIKKFLLS